MKKTALLLLMCICFSAFASCDDIGSPSGKDTEGSSGNNITETSGNENETETEANANEDIGENTTGENNGNDTETSSEGNAENTTDANSNNAEAKGDVISEEIWAAAIAGEFTNYSYIQTYSSAENSVTVIHFYRNGDEWIKTTENNGVTEKLRGFLIDGKIEYCYFDYEQNKWAYKNNYSYSFNYPLTGMPYSLSEFDFDEESGTYSYAIPGTEDQFTDEQITQGLNRLCLRFKDGYCVYMQMPYSIENETVHLLTVEFSNYNTTELDIPAAENIVGQPGNTSSANGNFGNNDAH